MGKKQKYVVVTDFRDLQDDGKLYEAGKPYPRPVNKKVSNERIEELLTKKSKQGTHFIQKVVDEKAEGDEQE